MSTLVLMKAFESVPARYDFGMRLITFGEIASLRREIADAIPPYAKVLDIGCGTGELLPLLVQRGARVTAIDKEPLMVATARERAVAEHAMGDVSIRRNTAMEVDRLFGDGEFDAVVLSLVMSELTVDERSWLLAQCARILKKNGFVMLADEFQPESILPRIAFSALRFPAHLLSYMYTQIKSLTTSNLWWRIYYAIVELPLMLLSFFTGEPLTRPIKAAELGLPTRLKIVQARKRWGGAIQLLKIQKEEPAN
jgi:ubiquinone/menaquinone biosynthesis C-methylase UbiE